MTAIANDNTYQTISRTKRGFFGWSFLIIFWVFQAIMIKAIFINVGTGAELMDGCSADDFSAACQTGTAIGVAMVGALGWMFWIVGTMVLGLFVLLTRGKMVSVTKPMKAPT
jgi:hypothetical protein